MVSAAESTTYNNAKGYTKNDAVNALRKELEKGIKSFKNGDVYSVEEAWEEIDKI